MVSGEEEEEERKAKSCPEDQLEDPLLFESGIIMHGSLPSPPHHHHHHHHHGNTTTPACTQATHQHSLLPLSQLKTGRDYFLQGKPSSKRLPQLGDHPASSSSSLLRLRPAQPFAAMVASALFIMDLKGKIIISRNYRGDIPLTVSER